MHYDFEQFIWTVLKSGLSIRADLSHKFVFDETLISKLYPIQMNIFGALCPD